MRNQDGTGAMATEAAMATLNAYDTTRQDSSGGDEDAVVF